MAVSILKKNHRTLQKTLFLLLFLLCFCFTMQANPFFSQNQQKQAPEENTQEQPQTKKMILPVRIGSGNRVIIEKQGKLQEKLGNLLYTLKNNNESGKTLLIILTISFLYGILHAAGPGHRKTIVFSLYIAREAPWWEPAIVSILLAILHGGAAILCILIFSKISGSIAATTDRLTIMTEGFSYLLVIAATFIIMTLETIEFIKKISKKENDPGEKNARLLPFIISGAYPCPCAILILAFCFSLHLLPLGTISVLVMSFGMTIPIMSAAYLAWFGRTGLFAVLKQNQAAAAKISYGIEMTGYTLMLILSLYIAWPFIYSLVH